MIFPLLLGVINSHNTNIFTFICIVKVIAGKLFIFLHVMPPAFFFVLNFNNIITKPLCKYQYIYSLIFIKLILFIHGIITIHLIARAR